MEIYKIVGPNDGVVGGKIVKRSAYTNVETGREFRETDFN